MIDLCGQQNRLINQLSRIGAYESLRLAIVSAINWCRCPYALRSDSEHKFFRSRERILRKLAERKYIYLHETEDGRIF